VVIVDDYMYDVYSLPWLINCTRWEVHTSKHWLELPIER